MSDPPSSSTSTLASSTTTAGAVAHGHGSITGGACFLDLPFELRTMVYDLSLPQLRSVQNFPMPGDPKPTIQGINLLQSSRQIHLETSQRLRCLGRLWRVCLPLPYQHIKHHINADCSFAMSCLNDLALARIESLAINFTISNESNISFGITGLEVLLKLKSLFCLIINVTLESPQDDFGTTEKANDLANLPFIVGFVIRVLSYIPSSVFGVGWYMKHWNLGMKCRHSNALAQIAEQYKSVRASAYKSQASNSSSDRIQILL